MSFGVSGAILFRTSSDSTFLKTRRDGEGESSRTGVDVGGSDCRSVASIGDRGTDTDTFEVSGASPFRRSFSDSNEILESLSFVTSGKG